jgi:Zn-dependent protease
MDATQLTIIIISFALAILLIVLGIQVWYILKEMRLSLQKMNKMLDDAGRVSGAVSDGVIGMSGFVSGLKTGISAITSLLHKKEDEEKA